MQKVISSKKTRRFAIFAAYACLISVLIFVSTGVMQAKNFNSSNNQPIEVLGSAYDNFQTNSQVIEQPIADGVNLTDYEDAILYLINTTRVSHGLGALQPNQSLTDIARTRSNDMLSRNYFSHYSPDGKSFFNILKECGITYKSAGENLAHSKPASIGTPEAFLNAWMNSPSHAQNILRGSYGIIGIGVAENDGRRIVTTIFRNS